MAEEGTTGDERHSGGVLMPIGAILVFAALGTLWLAGVSGASIATLAVYQSNETHTPQKLAYGGVVDAGLLKPVREAGLIGADEVPDAYHAEDMMGRSACLISTGRVIRYSPEGNAQTPIASITSLEGSDRDVVIHGDTSVVCHFGEGEGGDRFRRMLEHR